MSAVENAPDQTLPAAARSVDDTRLLPFLSVATLLVSALLLFLIQPMFAKMVLPRLGGAPSVWSVAMVFFQAVLLAGYAYAHLLGRVFGPQRAGLVHLLLLAVTAMTLPIAIAPNWGAPPADGTALWLFGLFAASIGLPFFTLSASAPLLQSWFAGSGHREASNPYVLYAASNLGSFAALFAYPTVVEPLLTLKMQASAWSVGFAVLALLVTAVAFVLGRGNGVMGAAPTPQTSIVSAANRLRWIALAAVPSGLVIAVTAHLTTDVAATPFLWVIPLALYLFTFVVVFRDRPWISHATVVRLVPFAVAPLAISLVGAKVFWLTTIVLHLAVFTLLTLLCHGELYARRPHPERLTEFFLCTSFGGVLGGAFAGLLAPQIFPGNYEYPILIALALLALPGMFEGGARRALVKASPWLAVAIALAMVWYVTQLRPPAAFELPFRGLLVVLTACMLFLRQRPVAFAGLVVTGLLLTTLWRPGMAPIETARSFFGVHTVVDLADGSARLLFHGNTIHGAERLRNEDGAPVAGAPEPQSYYYPGSPLAEGIAAARGAKDHFKGHFKDGFERVAVVGLGTGSLACYLRGRESWTFFEIDPEVIRIASNPTFFTFLSRCAPKARLVLGDARLTLQASPDRYDLIVLDAFSSDGIPVHLLTREAIAGYLSKLTPHGSILVHISNRHLDLAPILANVARSEGLIALVKEGHPAGDVMTTLKTASRVVMLARTPEDAGEAARHWTAMSPDPASALWTDDYSNLLGPMLRAKFGS
ncbi:fused MFS/spermidine synthase [Bradyrhizobium sp. INPA03-11B]|uniref:fused MFS/spermidine synthase n=1 Tax=Bradyrhizobium sp. INPA03-11B TaxID=418598 RepID=UPI00338D5217